MTPSDEAARRGCLWVTRPDLETLAVTGSERLPWLQGVLSADVEHLSTGEGAWGLVLTKQGKILADVAVVAGADTTFLGLVGGAAAKVEDWLSQFLVMEDAAVRNVSPAFAWAMLHGPEAHAVCRAILHDSNSDAGAVCTPIDFTGLGGAALVAPREHLDRLRTAASRQPGVAVASDEDWLRLRVERVLPIYGTDIDDRRSPHEASLDRRAVSWTKGCYLGQEAVCMQDMRGKVKRRLVALRLSSPGVPEAGVSVRRPDGSVVGETRSAASSNVWGGPVAMALLSAEAAVPGTELRVGDSAATVIEPR